MWGVRRCGDKIWQKRSTKHLSTAWLAGSKQQTWLSLYLECQQLNYYTAQRECVCRCVHMHVCVAVMVLGWGGVWSCAVKCTDGWLIHQSCDSSITAVTISLLPPEFFVLHLFLPFSCHSPFSHILYVFLLLSLHWCSRWAFLFGVFSAYFAAIQVKHSICQRAIKKLNFNKIIAFIFYHIAKLVIIMLLFTHCTGIFISHCTSYNAKGDINNNTLLLQDMASLWTQWPSSFEISFFYVHSLFRENNHLEFPTLLYFFSFFVGFFCSFFKMQVERRAFNGLSTIPDSPAWNSSMNFSWKWKGKCL